MGHQELRRKPIDQYMRQGSGSVVREYVARNYSLGPDFARVGDITRLSNLLPRRPVVSACALSATYDAVRCYIEVIDRMSSAKSHDVVQTDIERIGFIRRRRKNCLIERVGKGDLFGGIERLVIDGVYQKRDLM